MSALEDTLSTLHNEIAKVLLDKIRNGEVTAAELNVARQFLKDNGIDAAKKPNTPLGNLVDELPFSVSDTPYHN